MRQFQRELLREKFQSALREEAVDSWSREIKLCVIGIFISFNPVSIHQLLRSKMGMKIWLKSA